MPLFFLSIFGSISDGTPACHVNARAVRGRAWCDSPPKIQSIRINLVLFCFSASTDIRPASVCMSNGYTNIATTNAQNLGGPSLGLSKERRYDSGCSEVGPKGRRLNDRAHSHLLSCSRIEPDHELVNWSPSPPSALLRGQYELRRGHRR